MSCKLPWRKIHFLYRWLLSVWNLFSGILFFFCLFLGVFFVWLFWIRYLVGPFQRLNFTAASTVQFCIKNLSTSLVFRWIFIVCRSWNFVLRNVAIVAVSSKYLMDFDIRLVEPTKKVQSVNVIVLFWFRYFFSSFHLYGILLLCFCVLLQGLNAHKNFFCVFLLSGHNHIRSNCLLQVIVRCLLLVLFSNIVSICGAICLCLSSFRRCLSFHTW